MLDTEHYLNKRNFTKTINGLDPETYIYRIENIDRLIESVTENKISFTNPETWKKDDPWEEFFGTEIHIGNEKRIYPLKRRVQCWSTLAESDAMWRIYSHKKSKESSFNGVKVKIKLGNYLDLIDKIGDKSGFFTQDIIHDFLIAGHVKYLTSLEIQEFLEDPWFVAKLATRNKFDLSYDETLFIKRAAFAHEKEVRIVWTKRASGSEFEIDDYSFLREFDYKSIIEEIELDPRLQTNDVSNQRDRIIQSGINSEIIKKSSLYEPIKTRPYTTKLLHEIASFSKIGLLNESDSRVKRMIDDGNFKI